MSIFKACDIRGIAGDTLTDEDARLIGRAVGTMIDGRDVVVAGDVRMSTPSLMESLIEGLIASGCDVTDIGIAPTPVYYFAKTLLAIDAGVMVTASHNPPEFNGFKPTLGKLPITESEVRRIGEIAASGEFISGKGNRCKLDAAPRYREFMISRFHSPDNADMFEVVVDCGNGCYSDIAPSIIQKIGYSKLHPLFCTPDGRFPNRSPNSAIPGNLASLSSAVVSVNASLGIAFDGDGDRVSFVDDRGRVLTADKCFAILLQILAPHIKNSKVVYDLKCSSIVPQRIAQLGGIPLAERSGHTFIKTRMIDDDAVFGGEISGHYFHKDLHGGDDGLYTSMLMAGYLAKHRVRLSDLADSVPEYAITPDIRVPYDGDRKALIEKIADSFPREMISRVDGVRVQFADGWALARVSVTEPVITLRFEAADKNRIPEIADEFLRAAGEIRADVLNRIGREI